MQRDTQKKNLLLQAVLASTIFVAPFVHAVDITVTPTLGTQTTAGDGSVEIFPSGQVTGNAGIDAIQLNATTGTSSGVVLIQPSNVNGDAVIVTTATGTGHAINAKTGGGILAGGAIGVGRASNVTLNPGAASTSNAVIISNPDVELENAGFIQTTGTFSKGATVLVEATATGVEISNIQGATIANFSTASVNPTIHFKGANGLLSNNGLITQDKAGQSTVVFTAPFTSITNHGNGEISNTGIGAGNTINITETSGSGTLSNDLNGRLTANGTGSVLFIQQSLGEIVNDGVMQNDGIGNAILVDTTALAGDITISGITNTNAINAASGAAIKTDGTDDVILTNGLINKGLISTGGTLAIDFQSTTTEAAIFQQAGTISGDVDLASQSGSPVGNAPVLVVSGGTIAGVVDAADVFTNFFEVSGGRIDGKLNFATKGDTLALSGGFIDQVYGNAGALLTDTVNISGGDFNLLEMSGSDASTVNILSTLSTNGVMNAVTNLNIASGATFTSNGNLLNLNELMVASGATWVPNSKNTFVGGGVGISNNGTVLVSGDQFVDMSGGLGTMWLNDAGSNVVINSDSLMTINGDGVAPAFHNKADSTLTINIFGPMNGPVEFGQLAVNSQFAGGSVIDLDSGSFLAPKFSGFLPQGEELAAVLLIDANASATIDDNSTLVQPGSAVISFTADVEVIDPSVTQGQALVLTVNRNSYSSLANYPATGVAGALDILAQGSGPSNNDLYTLLSQLDQLPTAAAVDTAMDSLLPPYNYGLIEASHLGMNSLFETVDYRIWDVAWHHRDHGRRHSGKPNRKKARKGSNNGDIYNNGGVWLQPIGAYVDQSEIDGVEGYHAKAVGGALGLDWGLTDCTTVGVALSYTNVNVDDKSVTPKDERVQAWMGSAYGSFDFEHGIFVDAMVAGAHNDYDVNRVIAVNNLLTGAHASFDGSQWGVQGDIGMALPDVDFFLAPFVRLKYVNVNMDDYTETGAGDLSLAVSNNSAHEFMGAIGVKLAGDVDYSGVEWVPELTAMLGYDFSNDGEVSIANFVGGSTAFQTNGVTPGSTIFDLGLGLSAMYSEHSVITFKYNLELRDSFVGNSGFIQYFYNWS